MLNHNNLLNIFKLINCCIWLLTFVRKVNILLQELELENSSKIINGKSYPIPNSFKDSISILFVINILKANSVKELSPILKFVMENNYKICPEIKINGKSPPYLKLTIAFRNYKDPHCLNPNNHNRENQFHLTFRH